MRARQLRFAFELKGILLAGLLISSALPAGVRAADERPIRDDEGRPHVRWQDAEHVVGKVAFVSGKVMNVSHSGRVHFLNFEERRPARFAVIVYGHLLANFPDALEKLYEGKNIRVRGMVDTYRNQPQIRVADPSQIEILDSLPDLPPHAPARRPEARSEVTVATYNILNLFDPDDDPYHGDESTPPKPREEMEKLARSIRAVNADVLAMQEVENRGYLQRFLDVFLPDMGYEHVVHYEGNDLRGIDVCLVARLPIGTVRSYRHMTFPGPDGKPIRFERDLLAATIEPPGGDPFEVWVIHLKSNYEGRQWAEPIRLAEAVQVRRLLDERLRNDPRARIILCGDFNDTWDSPTLTRIVGTGAFALKPLFSDVPEDKRVTYNREPYLTMIDFLLCSPAMAQRFVPGSYRILPGSPETTGSDHNPVAARFRVTGSAQANVP